MLIAFKARKRNKKGFNKENKGEAYYVQKGRNKKKLNIKQEQLNFPKRMSFVFIVIANVY